MRHLLLTTLMFIAGLSPAFAANEIAFFTVDVKLKGTGLDALEVNISCDFDRPFSVNITIPVDDSRTVTVPVPSEGSNACLLTTQVLPAHQLKYLGDGGSTYDGGAQGCRFTGVKRGHANFCQIQVESQETSLTVFKRWVGTSEREQDIPVLLDCGPGAELDPLKINEGSPATWSLEVHTAEGLTCNVTEPESDDYTADARDCRNLVILAGAEEECTIVNTKVVKMIEALNRYGLVVMILVFMVVGGFAMRKII